MNDDPKRSPHEADTVDKICELARDNIAFRRWGILTGDTEIHLHGPDGQAANVPRDDWEAIVRWYNAPQAIQKRAL